MASPASGDPSPSSGVVASDGAVVADAALVPTARRTRFAPKVPSERRTRAARGTGTGEDTAEPKLSTHVEHLVKQAHLDGKTTRPREAVRGLEQRPRRGEGDLSKPGDTSAGGGGPGGTSTSAMDGLGTFLGNPGGAPSSQTHTPASFSAGKGGKMKEERHEKEPKSASAASGSRVEKHEQTQPRAVGGRATAARDGRMRLRAGNLSEQRDGTEGFSFAPREIGKPLFRVSAVPIPRSSNRAHLPAHCPPRVASAFPRCSPAR